MEVRQVRGIWKVGEMRALWSLGEAETGVTVASWSDDFMDE